MDHIMRAVDAIRQEGQGNLDCCVMVARALAKAADAEHRFHPGAEWWKRANVWDANAPYSSVSAAAEVAHWVLGVQPDQHARCYGVSAARTAMMLLRPDTWYAVQGWRADGTGHTFLALTHDLTPWGGLVVESSSALGLRSGGEPWSTARHRHEFLLSRLEPFEAGIGFCSLW